MTDWARIVRQLNGFPRPVPMEDTGGELEVSICPVRGCLVLWYGPVHMVRPYGFMESAMLHILVAHPIEWAEAKLAGHL